MPRVIAIFLIPTVLAGCIAGSPSVKPAAATPDVPLARTEPLGQMLLYAGMRDPECAPWFHDLSEIERHLIAAHLDQFTFALEDSLHPKFPRDPAWTFAPGVAPRIAITSHGANPPTVQLNVISAEVDPDVFGGSDRRKCRMLVTWKHEPNEFAPANIPLRAGTYTFLLDFSYLASPLISDPAPTHAYVPPGMKKEAGLYGVRSLKLLPHNRVLLSPETDIHLCTRTSAKNEPVVLSPGDIVLPTNINYIGAGATVYTYLGQTATGCRFICCSSFYDIVPTTYDLIEVPACSKQ